MSNRTVLNLIRDLDNMDESTVRAVVEELIVGDHKLAGRLFRKIVPTGKDVYLAPYDNKIRAIKATRGYTGMGLADSKGFTEGTHSVRDNMPPYALAINASAAEVQKIKDIFYEQGERVVVLPHGGRYTNDPAAVHASRTA